MVANKAIQEAEVSLRFRCHGSQSSVCKVYVRLRRRFQPSQTADRMDRRRRRGEQPSAPSFRGPVDGRFPPDALADLKSSCHVLSSAFFTEIDDGHVYGQDHRACHDVMTAPTAIASFIIDSRIVEAIAMPSKPASPGLDANRDLHQMPHSFTDISRA